MSKPKAGSSNARTSPSERPESSPPASEPVQSCEMVLCENPVTGEIELRPKGRCERGWLERAKNKMGSEGFTMILPPEVRTREEPAPAAVAATEPVGG